MNPNFTNKEMKSHKESVAEPGYSPKAHHFDFKGCSFHLSFRIKWRRPQSTCFGIRKTSG